MNLQHIARPLFATLIAAALTGCAQDVLHTEVTIDAPAEVVWDVLVDFEGHQRWDPFFSKLEGELVVGERLDIVIGDPDDGGMSFAPEVLVVDEDRELRWIGRVLVPGILDGEHAFLLVPVDDGRVTLIHEEVFSGTLEPLFWAKLDTETRAGFEEFNAALKAEAERRAD
jgi:hypothetical protein